MAAVKNDCGIYGGMLKYPQEAHVICGLAHLAEAFINLSATDRATMDERRWSLWMPLSIYCITLNAA